MKASVFLTIALSAATAIAGDVAVASPKVPRGPSNFNHAVAPFESSPASPLILKREECDVIGLVINAIGTSSGIVTYVGLGGVTTRSVCILLAAAAGRQATLCNDFAIAITGSVTGIYLVATRDTSGTKDAKRDEFENDSLSNFLIESLSSRGDAFESITPMPIVSKRQEGVKTVISQASVKGWNFQGTLLDAVFAEFGDGEGHIYVSPTPANTTSLTKRHDGAGFKVNYTTRQHSLLTQAHQVQMAQAFGDSWNYRANTEAMVDYFGLAKTDHNANFYMRIIPENNGYGENYESVDTCGGMARFL
ncbi:hypothetical protein PVAG01_01964 [Phlyctema vagabunda]|uniref:Uncharacterized protein n=1 Tax=Phlyctema vagabunda TaxID=108571 RepID=A0ABR4PYK9_9HELO